jgi:hypothetical protein
MQSSPIKPNEILSKVGERIPALVVGATTVCFVVGLLIVNLRQAQFGIYSLDFIRTEYMLVGAVFIFLTASTLIMFSHAVSESREIKTAWKERKYRRILLEGASFLFALIGGLQFIFIACFNTGFPPNEQWAWITVFTLIGFGYFARIGFQALATSLGSPRGDDKYYSNPKFMVITVTLLLGLLTGYSRITYPHISSALGGGNRNPVFLIPNSRGLEICKVLSLPFNTQMMVGPVTVLTETEKEIIILIPNELSGKMHAIRLNRELFDAVQATLPKNPADSLREAI